jgi:pseudouridine synthase
MERLQKVIAASGVASRRKAETLIQEGKVKVDGLLVTELGYKVAKNSVIEVNGKTISQEEKVYYVINKPKKYICSANDEHGRSTVGSLIDTKQRIYPVGRLDYESSGIIIMTNDGEFTNLMIHPRYHIKKTYQVIIKGILQTPQIKQLEKGIVLDDGIQTLPCKLTITNKDAKKNQTFFEITITEGRNRQIRRMMEAFDYEVTLLHRKRFGVLTDNDLNIGQYRKLKPFEIKQLRALAENGKVLAR